MTVARWAYASIALAGLLLSSIGTVMALALVLPETTCIYTPGGSDGICSITGSPLSVPIMVGGAALAIFAIAALHSRTRGTPSPKD